MKTGAPKSEFPAILGWCETYTQIQNNWFWLFYNLTNPHSAIYKYKIPDLDYKLRNLTHPYSAIYYKYKIVINSTTLHMYPFSAI
jgi:hypothetical protein